ncbi:hypothetical protein ACFVHQ_13510 [Actinomycetes bacterium NPDC127524]|nr:MULTISPECIES: hypothetical protein [unclassified Bacillus (in: firmicutes)]SFC22799.1 hypothetical protein SAMN05443252_102290 [Bacillus sp. OV322]
MKKKFLGFMVAALLVAGFGLVGTSSSTPTHGNVGVTELPSLF